MTDEERNSLSNLLYVCRNCHAMIDARFHGEREYPVDKLLAIKAQHESDVEATMDNSLATVGFPELEEATRWVTEVDAPSPHQDFTRIPLEDKIRKNGLSVSSQHYITSYLAAAPQVRSFIQSLSELDSEFPERLKFGFLEHYYMLRRQAGLSSEHVFNSMCIFARRGFADLKTQFAAQAVLVYLFETCEVFEQ